MFEEIMTMIDKRNAQEERSVDPCCKSLTGYIKEKRPSAKSASVLAECNEIECFETERDTFEMYKLIEELRRNSAVLEASCFNGAVENLLTNRNKVFSRWKEYLEDLYDGEAFGDHIVSTENVNMEESVTNTELEKAWR